ncbi:glycosyltransferase [Acinetobacter johnsonii]|uniref:glycosyltransferase n=1 Tax=Acinetobacter johnsonii TaxID=40214 RepID=UPI002577F879|nr:glycosyltransferase [Acinetobacter johnsonii]MDM1249723.1 glycosyltransferase [Acinetobacter johnsonii]
MKRIFFFGDNLHGGGAELFTVELIKALKKEGYDIKFFLLNAENIRLDVEDVDIVDLSIQFNNSVLRVKGKSLNREKIEFLKSLEIKYRPDILIFIAPMSYWLERFFLTKNKYFWIHGDFFDFNIKNRVKFLNILNILNILNEYRKIFLEKKGARILFLNKKIIVVNKDLFSFFLKSKLTQSVTFIRNGLPDIKFCKSFTPSIKKFDAVYVGRLEKDKRVELAIKFFSESKLTGCLAIVGDGSELYNLKALVQSLKLEKRVVFFGWLYNPQQIIAQSKILLLTSKYETFGLVVTEAHILGLSVVAFNSSSGVSEQFLTVESRIGLVEQDDFTGFVSALNLVYDLPYFIPIKLLKTYTMSRVLIDFKKNIAN